MKFAKKLREWQAPVRARVENFLKVESELSLYHQAANDEGNGCMDSMETVREQLRSIAVLLKTATEKIPLSVLRELYGGVDIHRVIVSSLFEQITGGLIRFNEDYARSHDGMENLREMYASASYPAPFDEPALNSMIEVPLVFRGLNGERFTRKTEVVFHSDWLTRAGYRLSAEAACVVEPIEVPILGLEEEIEDVPLRLWIDCEGESDQISRATVSSALTRNEWGDDSIINSGREIFHGPQDDALLFSVEDSELGLSWCGENERLYKGLRVWTEDCAGNEELLAIGEPGVGAVYFGPNPLLSQSMLISAV